MINAPLELAEKLKEALADEPPLFTQWFAGWLRHPYTAPVVVTAYVKQFPDEALIKEKLLGRHVNGVSRRLRLVLPKDEGVLHPRQTVRGFQLVSDVQIYLDLQRAGLRAEEQAEVDDLLIVENVGNLVCPASFQLGTHKSILIASIPEGDDKPYKYPGMYSGVDALVINKIDLSLTFLSEWIFFGKGLRF